MRRCRCIMCSELKHPWDHYKKPLLDGKYQEYVCSKKCWGDYKEAWLKGVYEK